MGIKDVRKLFEMYQDLQCYVRWNDRDARRVVMARQIIAPIIPHLIDDFYGEIQRHPAAAAVITGGDAQIDRLKRTLRGWLDELLSGSYDEAYVRTRWQVGRRHVEIGLEQAYATAAISRLRGGMVDHLRAHWSGPAATLEEINAALNRLLDLEIAVVEMAYQQHFAWKLEENSRQQVQQSERLAAIGQMVTGLAHESRNLLQRSHACLEALVLDIDDRPDAMKQARRIQSALDQLHRMYEEVRNYAAPIKLDLNEVDLRKLMQQSWNHLESKWANRSPVFEIFIDSDGPHRTRADAHRLDQVFTNLFQNAIDACGNSPQIECRIERINNGADWRITIGDNGPGISHEVAPRVFEPFFTTKSQGTGLGMAISRRIIEAHRGRISLGQSRLGGAEVCLVFPDSTAALVPIE